MSRIRELPKVELHVHIEGTLEPDLVVELAHDQGIELPYPDAEALRERYVFADLSSFLDIYYANLDVLRRRHDFARLAYEYGARAHLAGVVHAEVFFDPQAHRSRGVPLHDVVGGLVDGFDDARAEFGVTTDLIACFLRDRPVAEASAVLNELVDMSAPIVGVGLDSAEIGNPAAPFAEVFARAAALGLRRVAHAGEESGPESVREAIEELAVHRVDHGIRSVDDPGVMAQLAAHRIPLTVCPLSNVRLRTVADLASHPLPHLIEAGVVVTINSDDPAYFGGHVDDNFRAVAEQFALTDDTLAQLARNSVTASFLPQERRDTVLAQIDEWLAAGHPPPVE
ncbi:adenosine deaminase [Gordonia sp. Z-3]|uniref:adenosine deaminase n=1 Tax=Gordonia sp. Z-3 TaxID=3115408 RepID=UPI002E28655C|nr:adenosine deaminase [Gordonia sp. Z-3]MED5801390.1 adenosine deaminase [Gordonia sp. Z-3]